MDANELAMIAYDVMPGGIMTETGKGEMFGVLKMALRTLEAQHAALLEEADNETAEAKKLWREALAELESAKAELAAAKPYPVLEQMMLDMNRAQRERDAFAAELDAVCKRLANAQREIERLTQERDNLQIAYNSAMIDRDAFRKELNELRSRQHSTQDASLGRIHYAATQPGHLEP